MPFKLERTWKRETEKIKTFSGGFFPSSLNKDMDLVALSQEKSRTRYMVHALRNLITEDVIQDAIYTIVNKANVYRKLNLLDENPISKKEFISEVKAELMRHKLKKEHIRIILDKLKYGTD